VRSSVPASTIGGAPPRQPNWFRALAVKTSQFAGRPAAFICSVGLIVVWGVTGPIFHYSDTWQLVVNTGTTIVTFLMVFLIQATQNRDAAAIQLKLDELLRAVENARNELMDIEDRPDEVIERLKSELNEQSRKAARGRRGA
jgi:low affinity Fe/Cu permease